MGKVVSGITDAIGLTDSDAGARAVNRGTAQQVAAQREALEYMKEREAIPQQFREGALGQLGGLFGLQGGDPNADRNIRQNPIFQATLGQLPQQEEAILRNQSATGALRTGGIDVMLAENQRMNELSAYQNAMGGLQGLASLPSNTNQIASGMAGIGQTQRMGTIGAKQSELAGQQAAFDEVMSIGKMALAGFSDILLKTEIKPEGTKYGRNWYSWTWNEKANEMGLYGRESGVMAHEEMKINPENVINKDGYLAVYYSRITQ